jgi:protein-L-isoaspartate(D-aspartate) O-methyltransferase
MRFWRESDRTRMVRKQLKGRGLTDPRLLEAFAEVPREQFVPPSLKQWAHTDRPLGIECGQTISQPYIVALTVDKLGLQGPEKVLEIGTGSGYAAAILSRLAASVVSVERLPELAESARERLQKLGYHNVRVVCADGTLGYAPEAPYEAIAVAAGGPVVPESLKEQLAMGGRLVIPVGDEEEQVLL